MSHKVSKILPNDLAISTSKPFQYISSEDLLRIKDELVVTGAESKYGPPKTASVWRETVASMYLPFAYSKTKFNINPNKHTKYTKIKIPFTGTLREHQQNVYAEAIEMIKKHYCGNLSLHCGFGKTFMGIKIWTNFRTKGIVLCHRKVLIEQWSESVAKFAPEAKVQILKSSVKVDPTADFYIINMSKVTNRKSKEFDDIGFVIVDEAHVCCAEKMSKSLTYFCPKYILALTATPFRTDGMDKILDIYFGKERIVRISTTPFIVYKYSTGIVPEVSINQHTGKLNWNSVISSLVSNKDRNLQIANIVKEFPNNTILIMTKHIAHVNILKKLLEEAGETVTKMCSSESSYDTTARVLIGTYSKLGVGFDDSRLDMMISCISVKEIEQFAGRLRDHGRQRIVVDIVDDFSVLHAHYKGRKRWYESRNGRIIHANKDIGFRKWTNVSTDTKHTNSKTEQPRKRLASKIVSTSN